MSTLGDSNCTVKGFYLRTKSIHTLFSWNIPRNFSRTSYSVTPPSPSFVGKCL